MKNIEIGYQILENNGQSTRASFYAGRGPCSSDLSGTMLYKMFKDLHKINKDYGENFIRLVDSIPSIGATEFINAFEVFVRNDFIFEKTKENLEYPYNIEGTTEEEKNSAMCYALGALGIFSKNATPAAAMEVSNNIKEVFYSLVERYYKNNYNVDLWKLDRTEDTKISKDILRIINPRYYTNIEIARRIR